MGRFQFAGRTFEGRKLASAFLFVTQFHGSQRNWSSTSPESASQFEFCRGSNASGWTITIPHKTSRTSSACAESQIDWGTSEGQITRRESAPAPTAVLITRTSSDSTHFSHERLGAPVLIQRICIRYS